MRARTAVVLAAALVSGCGDGGDGATDADGGLPDASLADIASDAPELADLSRLPAVSDVPESELTYTHLFETHFRDTCGSVGCHEPGGFAIGAMINLTFTDRDASHRQLVGANSVEKIGWKRVAPGDPARSYLVAKLLGDPIIEQSIMPAPPFEPLPDQEIARIVEWIRRGALND